MTNALRGSIAVAPSADVDLHQHFGIVGSLCGARREARASGLERHFHRKHEQHAGCKGGEMNAATPIDLRRLLHPDKKVVRARYEFSEVGEPRLSSIIAAFIERVIPAGSGH